MCLLPIASMAQQRRVENRPYTDLRPFHFGVVVGVHMQDVELFNAGPQTLTLDGGQVIETNIAAEQDRYDPGFVVGVTGELRLNRHLQLRAVPAMYFGNRHLVFKNQGQTDVDGQPIVHRQDMKTAYISTAFNLIFAAPRFNNHRRTLWQASTPCSISAEAIPTSCDLNATMCLPRWALVAISTCLTSSFVPN